MKKIRIHEIHILFQEDITLPPLNILRCMLAKLRNKSAQYFFLNDEIELSFDEIETLKQWFNEFSQQKPLSKILEEKEFWSLNFITNSHTLDPRPDSELLIEQALKHLPSREKPYRILDLGTGTGCLLITLLREFPNAQGIGIDISHEALKVAQENAAKHQVESRCELVASNWLENVHGVFDIIISNPPYIQNNYPLENNVVLYDPPTALFGGTDGLDAYQEIINNLKQFCTNETLCFFEIGFDQRDSVNKLIQQHGLHIISNHKDLSGNDRVVVFRP